MVEVIPLVGLILSIAALVLDVALSFSPMYWYYRKQEPSSGVTMESFLGLWRNCQKQVTSSQTVETCKNHNDDNYTVDRMFIGATQVFQVMGFLLLIGAIVSIILKLSVFKDKTFLSALGAAHALWAALALIGSAGAFGNGIKVLNGSDGYNHADDLHFSFAFAVISGVVALAAGIVMVVDLVKSKD